MLGQILHQDSIRPANWKSVVVTKQRQFLHKSSGVFLQEYDVFIKKPIIWGFLLGVGTVSLADFFAPDPPHILLR